MKDMDVASNQEELLVTNTAPLPFMKETYCTLNQQAGELCHFYS